MKKSLKIGLIIIILVVVVVFMIPGIRQEITGLVTEEHKITLYASKSGVMSLGEENISFKYLNGDSCFLGGNKNYKHYEYFKLAGIPADAKIVSADLTLYREISGEELELRVRRSSELWLEYQTYRMKGRYPHVFAEESIASGSGDLVFDVSEMVQQMILPWEEGGGNHGFEISKVKKSEPRYFYFRNVIDESKRPNLEIVYSTRN